MTELRKEYPHYHKPCPYPYVDVYRVLKLFNVTEPCIQHAVKKLLVSGGRGGKDADKDIDEAEASLRRYREMREEEKNLRVYPEPTVKPGPLAFKPGD